MRTTMDGNSSVSKGGGGSTVPMAVLGYLRGENRPYSLVDIHNNMHREHGKTAMQQALDALVVAGAVRQKDNGKQKVFVAIDQSTVDESVGSALDERLSTLRAAVSTAQTDLSAKQALANSTSSPLTSEAMDLVDRLERDVAELRVQVSNAAAAAAAQQDGQQSKSNKRLKLSAAVDVDKHAILKRKAARLSEWRIRKRAVSSLIDAILQQDDMRATRQSLYEDIGVETDESVGISSIPT